MPKLKINEKTKLEIVSFVQNGLTVKQIHRKLVDRAIHVSYNAVKYHVNQYLVGNFDVGLPPLKKTRKDNKISEHSLEVIREVFRNDPYATSTDVRKQLAIHGTEVSAATVKKAIKTAGYVNSEPRYCQLIRNANQEKRVDFCNSLIEVNDALDNIIFTDECSVQLHNNKTTSYRRKGMLTPYMGKPKHPLKVHVWGGISRKGRTEIIIFDGIMKSDFFVEEILKNTLLPFVRETFGVNHRFQQDNDPKHRSKLSQKFMEDNSINWWKDWPSGISRAKRPLGPCFGQKHISTKNAAQQ